MASIRALIWDVDGTLSNTLDACVVGLQTAISRHGGPTLSRDEVAALFGPTEEGILVHVLGDDAPDAIETYLAEYERHHADGTLDFPGVVDLVRRLAAEAVPMAVVTGKGRRSAEITLDHLGLGGVFDPVATGSDYGPIKAGEIARIVAEWGFAPSEVAYIGDAPSDVTQAREAGVVAVSAAWHALADVGELDAREPDAIVTDVQELESWLNEHLVIGTD